MILQRVKCLNINLVMDNNHPHPSYRPIKAQANYILSILDESNLFKKVYDAIRQYSKADLYLGAGLVYQTVWNHMSEFPLEYGIDDIDIIYFDDQNLTENQEDDIRSDLQVMLGSKLKIDVKNQARVHLWYKDKFGYEIKPYLSVFDAVNSWPITAGSVIVCPDPDTGQPDIYTPYGLTDMLSMTVRANKSQITREIYAQKSQKWARKWPDLRVIDWDSEYNLDRLVEIN